MLQASALQSGPWGTRLGIRQYGCLCMGRTKVSWYSRDLRNTHHSSQYLPNLSGTKDVPRQGREGGKQPQFCTGCHVCMGSWL